MFEENRDGMSMSNPAVKKLHSFSQSVFGSQNVATYGGVAGKIGYFMALVFAGMIGFFAVNSVNPSLAVMVAVGATIIGFIGSLIAAFVPSTCAITGAIYAACEGYALTWISYDYAQSFKGIAVMALGLTVLVVIVMAVLYSKGIVKASQKLRAVCMTGLIVSIIGGLIYIGFAIFGANTKAFALINAARFGPLGIVLAIGGVILAAALLVFDFDSIAMTVENGLEKKYEWYAAYGLVVGIIYVYVKILELLVRIMAVAKNNNN